jgi:CheY-like chemotaxis protein
VDNARLYAAAEHERARLEEANRAKDEFLATVSHELRTPLTIILGWAQILQRGNLDAIGQARALELLERSAQAQAQVIEDLLDVSRAITGNVRLAIRLLELSPVIESAMDAVRPAAEAKGIRLEATLDRAAGPVSGDADRLQQVVWNLLSNAIKFTPSGGRVQVHLARADAQVEIGVSDTGPGIPPAFLPYVFDRFRQADSTLTRAHGGLGLGLAIVRHLVELHGGTVQATSPGQGQGASFTVRLPLARAGRAPALVEPARPAPAPAAPLGGARALDGLRLLVVDDEAAARELLTTLFQDSGAEVTAVASAAEVLAALDRARPDVLVADIAMPGVDGYALIRQVRACPAERGGRVPALALTAYAGPKDRARALAEGFQEHVSKPIDVPTLTAVVARLAGPTEREVPLSR